MSGTNDFRPFAAAAGSNVIPQSSYLSLPALGTGFQTGIAQSAQLNKVWRQSSILAAMIAQFICDETGLNAVDDGTIATLEANFITALQTATNTLPISNIGLNLFVSPSGSDSNSGLSSSTAFATMQHASLIAATNYNSQGNPITINVLPGAYTVGAAITGPLPGNGVLQFIGGGVANTSVILTAPGSCFSANNGARVLISSMTLGANVGSASSQGNCLIAGTGASLTFDHVTFNATQMAHIQSTGGQIATTGATAGVGQPYTISGSAQFHWLAGINGLIDTFGSTVTLTGTPNFPVEFALAQFAAQILCSGVTFTGAATGKKYDILYGGVLNSGGVSANLPGTIAGTNTSGYLL
jgi:hypothetical protein